MASTHKFGITIRVKDDGTVKVLDATNKQLKAIDKNAHKAGKATKFFGNHMHRMVGYATAYMGVGFAKGLIRDADALGKVADKLGVSTDMLQKYRYAAELSGVQTRTFDMALQRFTRRVAEAAKGTGEAKSALQEMGIVLRDDNGNIRSTEDLLMDVADAMQKTTNESDTLRLGFKLFDSEGAAVINALKGGADGLRQMTAEAERLGVVMDAQTIDKMEQANDTLTTTGKILKTQMTIGFAKVITAFHPVLAGFAEIADNSTLWIGAIGGIATAIATKLVPALIGLQTAVPWLRALGLAMTGAFMVYDQWQQGAQSRNQKQIDTMLATRARLQAQVSTLSLSMFKILNIKTSGSATCYPIIHIYTKTKYMSIQNIYFVSFCPYLCPFNMLNL